MALVNSKGLDGLGERLANELRSVGVIPGRNPDGVNDDPEKAGLVMREQQERIAVLERELATNKGRGWALRLIEAIDELALWEPGRKGYAAALRRLRDERDWAWRELTADEEARRA